MSEQIEHPPPITPEVHEEHDEDKVEHLKSLQEADEALANTEEALSVGRARLQNAIDKYQERMNVPRY